MRTKSPAASNISSSSSVMRRLQHLALALTLSGVNALAAAAPPWSQLARFEPVAWEALPDWGGDDLASLWPALQQQCRRPMAGWRRWCAQLPAPGSDALQRHVWLMASLQPYRIVPREPGTESLLTGYFEPQLEARRQPDADFATPLLDAQRRPLLYLQDPIDAVLLQVQGSARLRVHEPDGRSLWRRVAWAGDNAQPFGSLGRWLVAQGAIHEGQASWSAIKAWAARNPDQLPALLAANPRTIFFREEPLTDPALGPRGAQGLPLTPERSVAIDPRLLPYGSLLWLDSAGRTPLQRLVLAQDTGSAIRGALRADYFWGWSPEAFGHAARTQQGLRWWVLWPKP